MPSAIVHAFEIATPIADGLRNRYAGDGRVRVHPYRLGETASVTIVHYFDGNDMLTSRFDLTGLHGASAREIFAEIKARASVWAIDLLKIDTEARRIACSMVCNP